MNNSTQLPNELLRIDAKCEVDKITTKIREILATQLHRRGLIVAISGGIDSAVTAALCVKAIGEDKVFGLLLPEQDSSADSVVLGKSLADQLGIKCIIHDITPTLAAIGCYSWRDDAIRKIFKEYTSEWKSKIIISGGQEGKVNYFILVVQSPDGTIKQERMGIAECLQIVAATNYKQRIRKTIEYFHADRLNYAVVGTPNRLEYDQGFFVKNGDGSADINPIAHLYKTQIYALGKYLELPTEICNAKPSTDTYSMPQGQDEFYFSLPYEEMDIALWGLNNKVPIEETANILNISKEKANYIYNDILKKRSTTRYQHSKAILIEPVNEIKPLA